MGSAFFGKNGGFLWYMPASHFRCPPCSQSEFMAQAYNVRCVYTPFIFFFLFGMRGWTSSIDEQLLEQLEWTDLGYRKVLFRD